MSRFAILLGGDLQLTPRLRQQMAGARVIAADSGMKHAKALGLVPELWVGDFDSAGSELVLDYADVPRRTFPAAKDATDGEIAVDIARERGATELLMLGGLGGQADHVTAHLALLLALAGQGVRAMTTSGSEEAYPLVPGRREFALPPQARFSIVAWSDLEGLSLTGVQWPLHQHAVALGSSITLSNVVTSPGVEVSLASGRGIIFTYPANPD
jgi:thiamine pyrophosphokinase